MPTAFMCASTENTSPRDPRQVTIPSTIPLLVTTPFVISSCISRQNGKPSLHQSIWHWQLLIISPSFLDLTERGFNGRICLRNLREHSSPSNKRRSCVPSNEALLSEIKPWPGCCSTPDCA